ncbi:hypothetical protein FRC06_009113 [Ceratobasidium sp. 370]|nr:hypothetical protein FRC06_009113 [Ceratobasidium sp. 370]
MSLICLSLPATLRCAGIARTESILLLVPPAVEAVVSLFLIRAVWRNGRKRWLLVAEAWVFLILAVLDFTSHDAVRVTASLAVFEPFDRAVGALSVVPILLYMSFLFLLTRADLLPLINPASLRTIFQFTVFAFIPPVAMTNELGSLLGVAYRTRQTPSGTIAEIGFNSISSKTISLAFIVSTVALLGVFQLLIFFLCTWHIFRVWSQPAPLFEITSRPAMSRNRSNSHTSNSYLGDEPGVRGLSWLALALFLGAVETFVAFAPQGFVSTLIRRILRILARGFLLYSLVRGSSDGFSNLEEGTPAMTDGGIRAGGIRALISNPRLSTFAQLTPNATQFHNMPRAAPGVARIANNNPLVDSSALNGSPQTRVTVLYDQKSAPILQMRFSGLDVPDSSRFSARSVRSNSQVSRRTSVVGHGGHSTNAATPARSRTLSEKRSGPPLASITIPDNVVLAGVTATQSAASSRSSLPLPLPQPRESPPRQPPIQVGSVQRSSTWSSTSVNESLEGMRDLAAQFPGLPPRVMRRGPTQLAYAVEEESEPPSSRQHSREYLRTHTRADTEDSVASVLSSSSRRKPVPAHTPRGTIVALDNPERQPSIPKTDSGEQVVVEAHSALFPETADPTIDYARVSPRSSMRSSVSDLTSTAVGTASPERPRKPRRSADREADVEASESVRREVERNWMRRSRSDIVLPATSQSMVVSRTPEISAVGNDYMSVRAELEGIASPRSPWSATVPYGPVGAPGRSTLGFPGSDTRPGTPTQSGLPRTPPRTTVGLPANPRAGRAGSNVEGWGRKLSEGTEGVPTLEGLAAEEQELGEASESWQASEVLGRYEGEFVRRSMASYRSPSTSSDPFAADGPHAI